MINHKDSIAKLLLDKRKVVENKELTQKYSNLCAEIGHISSQLKVICEQQRDLAFKTVDLEEERDEKLSEAISLLKQIDQLSKGN